MKHYNFDEIIERRGTGCFKWDALPAMYHRDNLTSMWGGGHILPLARLRARRASGWIC